MPYPNERRYNRPPASIATLINGALLLVAIAGAAVATITYISDIRAEVRVAVSRIDSIDKTLNRLQAVADRLAPPGANGNR